MAANKNKRKLRAPKVADSELSRVVTDIYDELNKLSGDLSGATEQRIKITTISQSDLPLNPVFQTVTANTFTGDLTGNVTGNVTGDVTGNLTGAIHVQGKNETGGTLTKGTPVYISGQVGNGQQFSIGVADSDDSSKMPSIGVLAANVNDNAQGDIVTHGKLLDIDTSAFSVGDQLFIGPSGTLVNTPPTGEANLLQKIAKVIRVDSSAGQIYIMGAGRTNAVPNLDQGAVFIGDSNNQAVASTFSIVNEASPLGGGSLAYSNGTFTFTPASVPSLTGYVQTISTSATSGLLSNEDGNGIVTMSLDVDRLNAETTVSSGDFLALSQAGDTKKVALSNIDLSLLDNSISEFIDDYTVTQSDVTAHQAALTIAESQISPALNYDNYDYWTLTVGLNSSNIASTDAVTFIAGDNVTLEKSGSNITINSDAPSGYIDTITTSATSGLTSQESSGNVTMALSLNALTVMTATPDNQESIAILEGSDTKKITLGNIPLAVFDNTATGFISDYTVTQADVTQHQSALAIAESQITFSSSFIELADLSLATAAASGGGSLSYDNTQGLFTFAPASIPDVSSFIDLTDLSIGNNNPASGSGAISYSSSNGVFTYTPPDLSPYLTSYTETNDLSSAVTWANVPDTNITSSSVTQHIVIGDPQPASGGGALAFTNGEFIFTPAAIPTGFITAVNTSATSGLSGGASSGNVSLTLDASALTADTTLTSTDVFIIGQTGATKKIAASNIDLSLLDNDTSQFIDDYTVTQSDVTQHQAALSITESQITFSSSFIEASDLSLVQESANGGGSLQLSGSTFTFRPAAISSFIALTDLSAANDTLNTSVSGSLSYSSASGTFTFTPPDLSGFLTSLPSHNHDSLYYRKSEVDGFLSGKDNYQSWTISDSTSPTPNTEAITSGATLKFAGSGATSVSYNASNNIMTISSTDTNTDTNSFVSGGSYDASTKDLTLTITGQTDPVIDLTAIDADKLDGQEGSYYLNYNNFSNTPSLNFDNYDHWTISDGTNFGDIDTGATLTVAAGTGITTTYSSSTQTLTIASTLAGGDITAVNTAIGSGLSGGASTGEANLQISVLNLTDMTDDVVGGDDELIIRDASVVGNQTRRKAINEIKLSQFNNDAGFGAGDITGVTAGAGLSGGGTSGAVTLSHSDTSSQVSVDNSNGSVIQDVTLDTYGHVTGLASANLDNRYLQLSGGTLTGSLTVQSVTAISTSAPKFQLKESDTTDENKEILLSGGDFFIRNLNDDGTVPSGENILKISHEGVVTLLAQGTTTAENLNALFQDGNGVLKRRTLGSNAFNSTTIPTNNNQLTNGAGYTTNVGDITGVTAGNGLSGGGTSGAVTLAVDFSELPSNPPVAIDSTDQLIWYETGSGTENRTVISSFPLSAFDNDSSFINQTNGDARYLQLSGGTLTGNLEISNGSPTIAFETGATHYNWQIGAQENVDAAFEISVGSQDANAGDDTFSPKLVVKQSGNVGIGTTSPSSLLHVSSGTSGDATVIIESDTDNSNESDNPRLLLKQDGGAVEAIIGITGDAGSIYTGSKANSLYIRSHDATHIVDQGSIISTFVNGNVGIGTTSPSAGLHVESSDANVAYFIRPSAGTSVRIGSSTTDNAVIGYTVSGDFARFGHDSATNAIAVNSSGNVGIGTTSPSDRLEVKGATAKGALVLSSGDTTIIGNDVIGQINFKDYDADAHAGGDQNDLVNIKAIALHESGGATALDGSTGEGYALSFSTSKRPSPNALFTVSEAMRIDSSGNAILNTDTSNTSKSIRIGSIDGTSGWSIGNGIIANSHQFLIYDNTAGSSRLLIDSSGNVLVGKTTSSIASEGVELFPNDRSAFTRDSGYPILVNRLTSDGDLINFRKDGTTVGAIGVEASDNLFIQATNGTGLTFPDNSVVPRKNGSNNDNGVDLGHPSVRWKDFYLGGDANIDGNVGIGTNDPKELLHVYQQGVAGNYYDEGALQIGGTTNSVGALLTYHSQNSGRTSLTNLNNAGGADATVSIGFGTINTSGRPTNEVLTVNQAGKVGIGTTNPFTQLHVDAGANYPFEVNSTQDYMIGLSRSGTDEWWFKAYTDGRFAIHENGVGDKLTIKAGGNVGIGTTSPSAVDTNNGTPKLQVETDASLGNHPLVARFTVDADAGDNSGASILINSGNDRGLMISAGRAVGNIARSTLNIVTNTGDELTDGIYLGQASTGSSITNVGIGTTSPSTKLYVDGGQSTFNRGNSDGSIALFRGKNAEKAAIGTQTSYFLSNVGIGTTSPVTELDVEGTITANNLTLNNLVSNTSDTTVLTFDQAQSVRVRTLGSNAFNSTSYLPLAGGTLTGNLTVPNQIIHSGDTNCYMQFHSSDQWRVVTGGAERIEVSNVGIIINDGSNDYDFRVESNGNANMIKVNGGNDAVGIGIDPSSGISLHVYHPTADAPMKVQSGDSFTGITFQDTSSTNHLFYKGSENHFYFNGSGVTLGVGVTSITTTNLSLDVENKVRASGIMFGSDTTDANTLDDYEEGTFTPTIHAGASNIVLASNNYGKYTKIGNVVHCSGRFQASSLTTGSSSTNVELGGFPFAANTPLGTSTGAIAGSIGFAGGFAGEAATMMQIRDGETNAFLYYQNASLTVSNVKGNDLGSTTTIVFQITYHTT